MKQKIELTAEEKKKARKQNIIRIVGITIILVIICIPIFFLVDACGTHSAGDFKYAYDSYNGEKTVVITGLTKQGQQKEVLVVPESIRGYRVIGMQQPTIWDAAAVIESENLTTIYLHKKIKLDYIIKCPKFTKKFVIKVNKDAPLSLGTKSFIYSEVYFYRAENHRSGPPYPANTTYYYNYEGADNYGCYWLDNLDDGEKITYKPSDPTREGYKFDGWYCEPECLTPWNFETDTVKSSGKEGYTDKDKFIENKLYAKWI